MDKASTRVDGQSDPDVALPRGSSVATSATVSPNQVSPLPWTVGPSEDFSDDHNWLVSVRCGEDAVAELMYPEDAAYIVRAANSYPALVEALTDMLDRYLSLVNCGDCGHWDPEAEPHVIAARVVLAEATHG